MPMRRNEALHDKLQLAQGLPRQSDPLGHHAEDAATLLLPNEIYGPHILMVVSGVCCGWRVGPGGLHPTSDQGR